VSVVEGYAAIGSPPAAYPQYNRIAQAKKAPSTCFYPGVADPDAPVEMNTGLRSISQISGWTSEKSET
jgi:hypothetical protein